MKRCQWCDDSALYQAYHDDEWGVPVRRSRKLFEFLLLEGMQAGLSWLTVLRKRAAIKQAFAGFDPKRLAAFTERDIADCLQNAAIIRNRLKCQAAVTNARAYLALGARFSTFCWQFTEGKVVVNRWQSVADVPVSTPASEAMSKALKKHGFRFVGPTICYAFMQAVGMVNDHTTDCFRHSACARLANTR